MRIEIESMVGGWIVYNGAIVGCDSGDAVHTSIESVIRDVKDRLDEHYKETHVAQEPKEPEGK